MALKKRQSRAAVTSVRCTDCDTLGKEGEFTEEGRCGPVEKKERERKIDR